MMEPECSPTTNLWLVLPAVTELMDEDALSKEQAYEKLLNLLGPDSAAPEIADALSRLRSAPDDLSFRVLLGEECVRALESGK
jgi:hypothetical protein